MSVLKNSAGNYLEQHNANNSQFSHFTCKTHTLLFLLLSHSCGTEISQTLMSWNEVQSVCSNRGVVVKCWCTSWLRLLFPLPALSAQVAITPASRGAAKWLWFSSRVDEWASCESFTVVLWRLSIDLQSFSWCDINVLTVSLSNYITGRWTGLICLEYFMICFKASPSILQSKSLSCSS